MSRKVPLHGYQPGNIVEFTLDHDPATGRRIPPNAPGWRRWHTGTVFKVTRRTATVQLSTHPVGQPRIERRFPLERLSLRWRSIAEMNLDYLTHGRLDGTCLHGDRAPEPVTHYAEFTNLGLSSGFLCDACVRAHKRGHGQPIVRALTLRQLRIEVAREAKAQPVRTLSHTEERNRDVASARPESGRA